MKMRNEILLFLLLVAVAAPIAIFNQKIPEVGQHCMECICQASSNCNETVRCHKVPGGVYFCGAYVISWAYWHDGGQPGYKGDPHDFETCLANRTCAEVAVRGYMARYGQDCDQSGRIDCFDFARLHKLGFGPGCAKDDILHSRYWQKFVDCYNDRGSEDRSTDPDDRGSVTKNLQIDPDYYDSYYEWDE